MRKTFTLLFSFCALLAAYTGNAQVVPWISQSYFPQPPQGPQFQDLFILDAELDGSGNSYVAYEADENIVFGSQTYPAVPDFYNGYMVKYDANGAILWVRHIAPTPGELIWIYDIALDDQNNLYAAISFQNSIIVDGVAVNSPSGTNDFCLAKWDSAGTLQWVVNGGGAGRKAIGGIAIDSEGNIVAGGNWEGNTTIGGYTFTPDFPNAHYAVFLAKFSANGNLLWAREAQNSQATGLSSVSRVQLDAANNLYLFGNYSQGFSLGNSSLVQQGNEPYVAFWAKCDPDGEPLVMKGIDVGHPVGTSLEVDPAGNSYLASAHYGSLTLGNITLSPPPPGGYSTYVYKMDPNGVVQWVTDMSAYGVTTPAGANGGMLIYDLARDNAGKVYIAGHYSGSLQIGGQQMPVDSVSGLSAFIASLNETTGNFNWVAPVVGGQMDHRIVLDADLTGGLVFGARYKSSVNPIQVGGAQAGPVGSIFTQQTFFARVLNNYNTITGHVFADMNLNGVQDTTESGIQAGHLVRVDPTQFAFVTNNAGNYTATTGLGSFQLVPQPLQYYTFLPLGLSAASFSSYGNIASGYDFAVQPIPNQQDLELFLTNLQPVRPGFQTSYRLTYKNPGTVTIPTATVSLTFDPLFSFQTSSQAPVQTGNTLTWTFSDIQPLQTAHINLVLELSPQAPLLLPVTTTASIAPVTGDLTPANNSDSTTTIISGSYDPNSIEVDFEQLSPLQVQNQQKLDYTIRFQNLGTDTAFTVMIRDSIPASLLQLGSLELLSSSHTCTWNLDAAGVMTVTFTNIRLPHEAVDSLGSNGFVRFRIKVRSSLAIGNIIPNQAHIYFDFNLPISTNIAQTEVVQQVSAEAELDQTSWQLYPNPAADAVTVKAISGRFAEVNLRLLNVLGQEVYNRELVNAGGGFEQEIHLSHLPSGVYSVQLQTEQGSLVKRLVKQ